MMLDVEFLNFSPAVLLAQAHKCTVRTSTHEVGINIVQKFKAYRISV